MQTIIIIVIKSDPSRFQLHNTQTQRTKEKKEDNMQFLLPSPNLPCLGVFGFLVKIRMIQMDGFDRVGRKS